MGQAGAKFRGFAVEKPCAPCIVCGEYMTSTQAKPKHKKCYLGAPCIVCGKPVRGHTEAQRKNRAKDPRYPGILPPRHRTCIKAPTHWPCELCGKGVKLSAWQRNRLRQAAFTGILCGGETCIAKFKETIPLLDIVGKSRYENGIQYAEPTHTDT